MSEQRGWICNKSVYFEHIPVKKIREFGMDTYIRKPISIMFKIKFTSSYLVITR